MPQEGMLVRKPHGVNSQLKLLHMFSVVTLSHLSGTLGAPTRSSKLKKKNPNTILFHNCTRSSEVQEHWSAVVYSWRKAFFVSALFFLQT